MRRTALLTLALTSCLPTPHDLIGKPCDGAHPCPRPLLCDLGACVTSLPAVEPAFDVEPDDDRAKTDPRIACDEAGCSLSWNATDPNSTNPKMGWLRDGGVDAIAEGAPPHGYGYVRSVGAHGGARYTQLDVQGSSGDYNFYLDVTAPGGRLPDSTSSVFDTNANGTTGGFAFGDRANLLACGVNRAFARMHLRRFNLDGTYPEAVTEPLQGPNHVGDPSVAFFNGAFFIVFADRFDSSQWDTFLTVWSEDNTPIAQHLPLPSDDQLDDLDTTVAVADDRLLAGWRRGNDVVLYGIDGDAGVSKLLLQLDGGRDPRLSWRNGRGLLALVRMHRDGGEAAELDELVPSADGGLNGKALFSEDSRFTDTDTWVGHESDSTAWFAYTVASADGGGRLRATRLNLSQAGHEETVGCGAAPSGASALFALYFLIRRLSSSRRVSGAPYLSR